MNIKENIKHLFKTNLPNSEISKETGIAQTTLSRFTRGESKIGNMLLDNATKLNDLYNKTKLKRTVNMNKIYNTIINNFEANGENGKYVSIYESLEDIVGQFGDIETFTEKFGEIALDSDFYPIITLDDSNSSYAQVFTRLDSREDIMQEAYDFFDANDDGEGVWEFAEYAVYEESDMLRFENNDGDTLGYVSNHNADLQEDLNKGADPIGDGWEDGVGNTVDIDGWINA